MKSPLHILHLEDDPNDAELIHSMLEADGIACRITRVDNRGDFLIALEKGDVDLILSDFTLPSFDGLSAAGIVREHYPDTPLILVSGTLGEEQAIVSLKSGATDYILKDRLARLAPAVRRAMKGIDERTERLRLESQFIEAQKMEVIGHLASGVAHDFNNILAVIMGNCDLLSSEISQDSPLRSYADEIKRASERAIGLTQQLLIFSRKQVVHPVVLDLNTIVKDMESMLRRLMAENIELIIIPGENTGHIRADSGYVGQVLMNLVVNARDAMANGGKLIITTSNITLDQSYTVSHPGSVAGDFVMLGVSDTGTGISEDVKLHMFEAFFTTKPINKGTGLGLATCQTIVQQSGGYIGVYSEIGTGTTFKVFFPNVKDPYDLVEKVNAAAPLPRGTETLLVVEDEPALRNLAVSVLSTQGYDVLEASNGQEALRVSREHMGPPIRLVVTDVIMPLMGGKVMASWLRATHPDLRILFTSGYTEAAISDHGIMEAGVEFLPKPYTPVMLASRVRAMLDRLFINAENITNHPSAHQPSLSSAPCLLL